MIVVTETDVDKRVGLRSLLKSPKEPMDREKDRGRNVSFFDDVTIYLFDQVISLTFDNLFIRIQARYNKRKPHSSVSLQQETPTNELSSSAPTSPAPVSIRSTKLDLRGKIINIQHS